MDAGQLAGPEATVGQESEDDLVALGDRGPLQGLDLVALEDVDLAPRRLAELDPSRLAALNLAGRPTLDTDWCS